MERFVRNLLSTLPTLEQIEAKHGHDYPRLAGALAGYYFTARAGLLATLTDPDDEEDEDHETGDPIAAMEVEPLDDETCDVGRTANIGTDATRHDLRGAV